MSQVLTTRRVLTYMTLPGILPRLREFLSSGFGFISFFLAQIYGAARLLPAGHPYLNTANAGRYSIRDVVRAAAARLIWRRDHIDQIIIFFALLAGIVILFLQIFFLAFALFVQVAHANAMPTGFGQFFITQNPQNDIAFVMLDRVFGVPNFFNSCVATDKPCFQDINPNAVAEGAFPWPFHAGLHAMLQFYSIGLLVVAVMIFLYFVVAVAAETAQTGTPFGRRFNHVWAPLRMVMALGMLVPVANGLNGGQYILLYAAKWGSGFATNGWDMFVSWAVNGETTLAGDQNTLVVTPETPELTNLLEFMTVADTCWASYGGVTGDQIQAYFVGDSRNGSQRTMITNGTTFEDGLAFYGNKDILFRFGSCRATANNFQQWQDCSQGGTPILKEYDGYVAPLCGEVILPITGGIDQINPGAYYIQQEYFNLLRNMWLGSNGDNGEATQATCPNGGGDPWNNLSSDSQLEQWGYCIFQRYGPRNDPNAPVPTKGDLMMLINGGVDLSQPPAGGGDNYRYQVQQIIANGVTREQASGEWVVNNLTEYGWGGASNWYNLIAQENGAIITTANSLPRVKQYPMAMEDTSKERLKNDKDILGRNVYQPIQGNDKSIEFDAEKELIIAKVLWQAYDLWSDMYPKMTNENLSDLISIVFGRQSLFNLRDPANANIHPLALLVGLGNSLINMSAIALGSASASGLASVFGESAASAASGAAGLLRSIGITLLGAGFILYYVVPMMPFLYFFFAIGAWVKGIFEAMVGVPLWALAHIRIDGEGLPGQAGLAGYFLILEIFLRPILIVFGMLASFTIFAAQVHVLNDIWSLVTSNLSGFDTNTATTAPAGSTGAIDFMRDKLDQFFFTVIYALFIYMLGTSSFKLIDQIPAHVTRWMGQNVQAFEDKSGEQAVQGLVGKIGQVGSMASSIGQGGLGKANDAANSSKQIASQPP